MKSAIKKKPTNDKKKKFCAQSECRSEAISRGFCRLHYIANWKLMKLNRQLKAENKLNHYVESLAKKYPKDFMEKIKESLEDENKFKETAAELEIDLDEERPDTDNEFLEKFFRDIKGDID